MTSLASFLLLWGTGYEPRHRHSRREIGIGRLARRQRKDVFGAGISGTDGPGWPAQTSWLPSPPPEPWFPDRLETDRLETDRLRRALEGCPADELTRIIPEIAQVIVHSKAYTMTTAWNDFRAATRNNPQEDAVVIRLGPAHEALWLITNAPLNHATCRP
ncbi:MAG TPA: hypothetical protein VMF87_19070 [Streptosporangiaceae bacterium]|nr:hypothetical protein [Streptosporangiaceae bacterium]